ncbi:biotin--[acetyl-CoA-carboxylase] ligase [Clostridium sp. 'deep sea']|uniref:biotin--[acetyl-CoA-carboxylase] ligase n=1 Tax=Clostridium sp. 'deep sea' TaxID=2779445 RepID=UPI0018966748|nr:biotin--[acetyl-CoA-carboxylase] ligase [Clostridium sp. 'deep sea']QOR35458.1 biotin--[acetyl-CoA-carboxylase] ligase [Clostridium sp. 'deep sea']
MTIVFLNTIIPLVLRRWLKIKNKILAILEEHKGSHVSGSYLGDALGVSRSAIWKSIKSLKDEGYNISSKTNKGYILSRDTDVLSLTKIKKNLNTQFLGKDVQYFKTITSTNKVLRDLAHEGAKEGLVLIAEQQTAGRGRNKKSFYSPNKNGIYMSLLLKPNIAVSNINLITFITAVCVAEAIEKVCGISLEIKWVNDLLYQYKKVCGILTEASIEGESGIVDFLVVGIGINIDNTLNFPEEFKHNSIALKQIKQGFSQSRLVAEILNVFEKQYNYYLQSGDVNDILVRYRERLCVIGKKIEVITRQDNYLAEVIKFNNAGQLIVKKSSNGDIVNLVSGEISIKL